MKKYILTIAYDDETDQVEYLSEELVTDDSTFYYGDIDLGEYWDDEVLKLMKDVYIIGES